MNRVKPSEHLKSLVLLYVEDEEFIRESFELMIKRYFKKIYIAKNGAEGLEIFKNNSDIDLIISDIRMPKMTGLEMAQEIKQINYEIPILFTTAFGDSDYLQQAIDVGADGYIIKPIDRNKVFERLNMISANLIAKKRTKEYFNLIETLINHQKSGVVLLDNDLNILLMNNSLKTIIEQLEIENYKVLEDLLVYCFDESGEKIDSKKIVENVDNTLICHGKKTGKYYELEIQNINNYFIINLDDVTEYKLKEEKIQETAMIDELTNVYNRKKIEIILDEITRNTICIVMFDIDNFKRINDTYGHLKGDEVLRELSNVVKNNIRSEDLLIRWGGEEFIVILKGLENIEIARKLAEKLRNKILEIEIEEVGHFSCSFGVSCGYLHTSNDFEKILNQADEALYVAKRNGKNRVEISQ